MSLIEPIIDPNVLRRQLSVYRSFLEDDSDRKTKVDILLKLPSLELIIVKLIHERGFTKAKDLETAIHVSRSTILKYCKQLEDKGIILRQSDISEVTSNIKPTYFFSIGDEEIKVILAYLPVEGLEERDGKSHYPEDSNSKTISSIVVSNDHISSEDLASITQKLSQISSTGRNILELIDSSGINAKSACEKVKCSSATANKYLKEFFDRGWLIRTKDATDNGQYTYYLTSKLSIVLNSDDKVQQKEVNEANEVFMENQNLPNSDASQSENQSFFASQIEKWINLRLETREVEKNLIAKEGKKAEEILVVLEKTVVF